MSKVKVYPQIGLIYSHYKGGMYEPLFISTHSETGEVLINYKSVHFGTYHSRPLSMWFDEVRFEDDGYNYITTRFRPFSSTPLMPLEALQ